MDFLAVLKEKPLVAALRDLGNPPFPEFPNVGVLFLLGGTIFDIPRIVDEARRLNRLVFVDIDLIKGIGKDSSGVRYLARESRADGIITTKSNLVAAARKEGLSTVQRIFVLDSESLAGGLNVVVNSRPDAVEILPGLIVPKIMNAIRARTSTPVIAGGLITEEREVEEILASGAVAISTTSYHLL
ncbi:MAG: glycerol-3-phosphate responsive antiterminator [Deltaproteobacteria bacterium]|nr:glycerol-3-phosphate responsive antiterminator [Deltaproteobacteria bacterium]MBW2123719.1 glycerol-3-phosphate responsive antiterminator [Deltaproteobacteria bacterium]